VPRWLRRQVPEGTLVHRNADGRGVDRKTASVSPASPSEGGKSARAALASANERPLAWSQASALAYRALGGVPAAEEDDIASVAYSRDLHARQRIATRGVVGGHIMS
jgi:hypothetical protein